MFSKIDLRYGYHQVHIKDEYTSKMDLRTKHGHYEYIVVPFGLSNSPTTFMCLMNGVFKEFLDKFIIVFLDDILIYSKSEKEHEVHLRITLQILRGNWLYAKLSKCSFYPKQLLYFGHNIFEGVAVNPMKIRSIEDCPTPRNVA